jgi:hypothetical protein
LGVSYTVVVLTCFVMCGCVCVCVCVCVWVCNVWVCNVWVCVCVGVGVLVICALVFTVFCIVCTVFLYCFFYVYLLSFVLSVLL